MKVYIHLLILVLFSVLLVGCTGNKKRIEYKIENSWWIIAITWSIVLKDSWDIAYINQLSGSVMIDMAEVARGAIIHENSLIVTWSWAEVEIIFADSSVVRLSADSRLQISRKWTDDTILDLQDWSIWARVLKPFTDASFFTLETDDLSAWVRGTSVWMITNSGWTDIGIVDTTATGWQSSWATVDILNKAYFWSGEIHLSDEDILRVRHTQAIEHKKMKLWEQIKLHSYIWTNTIRDIRYMNKIIQDPTSQMRTRWRVHMEMSVTMPNPEEVTIFLTDPVIRSEIKKQNNRELNPTEFIRYLDIDNKIQKIMDSEIPEPDKKKAIEDTRKLISDIWFSMLASTWSSIWTGKILPIYQPKKVNSAYPQINSPKVIIKKDPCNSVSWEPCK